MQAFNLPRRLVIPLLSSGWLALTACGGGGEAATAPAETAPAVAVATQSNFSDENGNLDTNKVLAVQENYQANLEATE